VSASSSFVGQSLVLAMVHEKISSALFPWELFQMAGTPDAIHVKKYPKMSPPAAAERKKFWRTIINSKQHKHNAR